jgi:hypothetical protein
MEVDSAVLSVNRAALLLNVETDGVVRLDNIHVTSRRRHQEDEYYPILNRADYYAKKFEA